MSSIPGSASSTSAVRGTEFLKFKQGFVGGAKFDILNTVGVNSTFPSIERQARFNVGWSYEGASLQFFANHVGAYKNWGERHGQPADPRCGRQRRGRAATG